MLFISSAYENVHIDISEFLAGLNIATQFYIEKHWLPVPIYSNFSVLKHQCLTL